MEHTKLVAGKDLRDRAAFCESVPSPSYSTVTLLARLRGLSTSQPRTRAMW